MKSVIIAKTFSLPLFGRGGVKPHAASTSGELLDLHRRIKADLTITELRAKHRGSYQ
jgi:hypothetical protein